MSSPRLVSLSAGVALLWLAPHGFAQSSQTTGGTATRPAPASSAQKSGARPARGPLPDPALLDGSTQPVDKKSESGMLGEFEIPGDEDSKSGKVGGQQSPPGAKGGGGAQQPPQGVSVSLPGLPPMGMPSGAGAGGNPSTSLPDPTKSGAGGGSGAPETGAPPQGAGNAAGQQGAGTDAAGGIQVAELKTDGADGAAGTGGAPDASVQKPKPVGIGDPARVIKPAANAPGVVGAQTTAGTTQQMEKAVGGSGKGGSGDNGNRGVEKGRSMPAGL